MSAEPEVTGDNEVVSRQPKWRRTRRRTLGEEFDPRNNALNAWRLTLATGVILWHSWPLTGRRISFEPVHQLLSDGWVDGFFAISGFLITWSWFRHPRARDYFFARGLRILPGTVGMPDRHCVYHCPDRRCDSGWLGRQAAAIARAIRIRLQKLRRVDTYARYRRHTGRGPILWIMERFALDPHLGGVVLHRNCYSRCSRASSPSVADPSVVGIGAVLVGETAAVEPFR